MEGVYLQGLSVDELLKRFDERTSAIVEAAINKARNEEQERFISPAKVRQMFVPAISRQTLHNWTEQGFLQKHIVGRSVYYRYSEVIQAVKSIKRIERNL